MPFHRLIILIFGLSLILGLIIWLVNSIYQLYIQISFTAPLLANILIFLITGISGFLIYALVHYYNKLFFRKSNFKHKINYLPKFKNRKQNSLEDVRVVLNQVESIKDKVAKQSLLKRSKEIRNDLDRQEFKIIIFGKGSAGKTSLVNSLVGEVIGQVNSSMGTTKIGISYRIKLEELSNKILITDTPGILEMGSGGEKREMLAKQLSIQSDLLLFVIDNDLSESEYQFLKFINSFGKKVLLIFNKTDLYSKKDKIKILNSLRNKIKEFTFIEDIILTAANPQNRQLKARQKVNLSADINILTKKIVMIIQTEGQELITKNILIKSQRLGEEMSQIINKQRNKQSNKIINQYQWMTAGIVIVNPLPFFDMLATAAVNTQMIVEIGQVYEYKLSSDEGKELALSLGKTLIGLQITKGAVEILGRILQLNISSYLVGKVLQGVTVAYLTRIAGQSFIEYFYHNQSWGQGGIEEVVQRNFQLNRQDVFLKTFIEDAIFKIVNPLTDNLKQINKKKLDKDEW